MSGLRCSATSKRTGQQCGQFVTAAALVCRWHGGAGPQAIAGARRRLALAKVSSEMAKMGLGIEVDPAEALLAMVYEAAGNVAFLRSEVSQLPTHPVISYEPQHVADELEPQPLGGALLRRHAEGGGFTVLTPGLYGPDHLGDARRHILVTMYDDERERLANFSRWALAAGAEERRVALAEGQGARIVDVIVATLDDPSLGLTPAQREAGRHAAAQHLRSLAA